MNEIIYLVGAFLVGGVIPLIVLLKLWNKLEEKILRRWMRFIAEFQEKLDVLNASLFVGSFNEPPAQLNNLVITKAKRCRADLFYVLISDKHFIRALKARLESFHEENKK